MLLERLLHTPSNSPDIVFRRGPYGHEDHDQLVRDVIALANLKGQSPRYIVFGVDRQNAESGLIGLSEQDVRRFKREKSIAFGLIEPALDLAPIVAKVDGKTFAALEIKGCTDPPYMVKADMSQRMSAGECWVMDEKGAKPAERHDLDSIYSRGVDPVLALVPDLQEQVISVGLGGDPDCDFMEIVIPDASNPPSRAARSRIKQLLNVKNSSKKILGADDTGIARLVHAKVNGFDAPFDPAATQALVKTFQAAKQDHREADLHYFYEMHAVKLNMVIRNNTASTIEKVAIELSLPRISGFDAADRIYGPAGDGRSTHEYNLMSYPDVKKSANAAQIRVLVGSLAPGGEQPLFEIPLRLAVGPNMNRAKVAIRYVLSARGLDNNMQGRLKLKFRV
jgi:hypothetical protein